MASAYTPLGVQLMVTGEKAGLWGGYTNTNLEILEQIAGGYTTQAVVDGATTALTVSDGSTGATIATSTIKMTGALTGASGLSVPDDITGMKYLVLNATTGSQDVTFKTAGGTGVTWSSTDARLLWHDGTNIVDSGFGTVTASSTTTFTNKTLTSPKIGTQILDTGGNELIKITATGSAVNEITLANAATDNDPRITLSGDSTNIGLEVLPKGTGALVVQGNADQAGELRMYNDTDASTYFASFKPGTLTENTAYTLPTEFATTSGDVMASTDAGVLSWTTITGGASWQAVITADPANAVIGEGYFCNTTAGAFSVTLPTSAAIGDEISFIDYAGTFDTNNLTIARNSHNIQGAGSDLTVSIERAAFTLVYVDATQGWLLKDN